MENRQRLTDTITLSGQRETLSREKKSQTNPKLDEHNPQPLGVN